MISLGIVGEYLARIYELRASQQALAASSKAAGPAAPSNK
jgi:hypothetical protein